MRVVTSKRTSRPPAPLFRGPRTSVAVLDGQETEAELDALGDDIFAHFGMGCRSVTKVYLPEGLI